MKRFFTLRALAWATGLLPAFLVLVVCLENWTGARALAAAKDAYVKEGGSFDPATLLPAPVPAETNFMALPAFAGIADEDSSDARSEADALTALDPAQLFLKKHPRTASPTLGSCATARAFDWHAAGRFFSETGYIDVPPDATAAEMQASMERLHPLLKQLGDEALRRPEAVFVRSKPLMLRGVGGRLGLLLPHAGPCMRASRGLAMHALTATQAGHPDAATASILASTRLTHALSQEPNLIGLLAAITSLSQDVHALWALLHARTASDEQLKLLQAAFSRNDVPRAALQAVRGELVTLVQTVEHMKQQRGDLKAFCRHLPVLDELCRIEFVDGLVSGLVPDGWMDHNVARCLTITQTHLIQPLERHGGVALHASLREMDELINASRNPWSSHHAMALILVPRAASVVDMALYYETLRRQALIALAIERHRLAQGKLPESLQQLAPAPDHRLNDLIDDQRMRYRQQDGEYFLWSIGPDGKDNGGSLPTDEQAARISNVRYQGDWTWSSAPQMP